jgi:hypothetical protein
MGANQQTSVPAFTAGQVLTAQQQTEINTGIPVFADSTARTAAFGGTGEKVLAEGQYSYLEDTNSTEVYDGSSWITVGDAGLVLISSTTIGSAVSSVTVSNAFSATYDNYKIIYFGGSASATPNLDMILGSTTTGYSYTAYYQIYNASTLVGEAAGNASNWLRVATARANGAGAVIELFSPFLATRTTAHWTHACNATAGDGLVGRGQGFLDNATSYTAFTLTPNSGTITGGTIKVYGYKN